MLYDSIAMVRLCSFLVSFEHKRKIRANQVFLLTEEYFLYRRFVLL